MPQVPNKKSMDANKAQMFQWHHKYLFLKIKKKSTETIFLNYLILIVVIIFYEITQPLWIISKSIEFELCHMKLTTLNVDPRSNNEICLRYRYYENDVTGAK